MRHIVSASPDVLVLIASLLQRRQSLHPDVDLRATILEASMVSARLTNIRLRHVCTAAS